MNRDFIPSGDLDLRDFSGSFGKVISENQQLYQVSDEDTKTLVEAIEKYCVAVQAARQTSSRSMSTTMIKDQARADLEKIMRKIARHIRVNDQIDAAAKIVLRIKDRTSRGKKQSVPMEPPKLRFVRALHQAHTAFPIHELRFHAMQGMSKAKPEGAVRLELFVDLVPPNEPVPAYPGANGGRPWYLRSFTRSPIVINPPMARVPMRVVYWARWADSSGETGPFSNTAVGWIEHGLEHNVLQFGNEKHHKPKMIIEQIKEPETRTPLESMAILEAHFLSFVPKQALPENVTINRDALPSPEEETEAA